MTLPARQPIQLHTMPSQSAPPANDEVMLPQEVAELFRVDPKTVGRWVHAGKMPADCWFRTPGRHLRFYRSKVMPFLLQGGAQ